MAGAGFGWKFGPLQERQRLAQHYAAMTDGELRELAREAESLTDEAQTALAAEMERREIVWRSRATPKSPARLFSRSRNFAIF